MNYLTVLKIKNKYKVLILFSAFLAVILLSLYFSPRFNGFVFTNFINPYNPVERKTINSRVFASDSFQNIEEQPVDSSFQNYQLLSSTEYWKDPRGLFPIFAYGLPKTSNNLRATLKIVERSGVNIIINSNLDWMPAPNLVKEAFDRLGNTDLRWLVTLTNECKDDFIFRNSNDETNSDIKPYLNSFNDNYVYGWYIWDEPGSNRELCSPLNLIPNDDYADINTMVKQIRTDSIFSNKLDFVNLFPTYWDGTPTTEAYKNYIDAFISSQEYKPRVLCFDHYPWLKEEFGGFRKDFYLNLDIIREKSIEYNIPFWMVVLSSGHLNYIEPTFEEISLQVYSALAYGAKGIGYYIYSRAMEKIGYTSWILEDHIDNDTVPDSLHGPLFVPIEKLNSQVQRLGQILMDQECVQVIHSSNYPNNQSGIEDTLFDKELSNGLIKRIVNDSDQSLDPKILIGIFKNRVDSLERGRYLMFVNKDINIAADIILELDREYNIYRQNKNNEDKDFLIKSNNLNLLISPACGELIYIE